MVVRHVCHMFTFSSAASFVGFSMNHQRKFAFEQVWRLLQCDHFDYILRYTFVPWVLKKSYWLKWNCKQVFLFVYTFVPANLWVLEFLFTYHVKFYYKLSITTSVIILFLLHICCDKFFESLMNNCLLTSCTTCTLLICKTLHYSVNIL